MFIPIQTDVPMSRWPLANWALILLTVVVSVGGFGALGGRHPPETWLQRDGFRAVQLVTHQFHHAGLMHLGGNMLFLFVFGNAVNARLGHAWYLTLYLACGIVAGLAWMAMGQGEMVIGASGAIMGILGLFAVYYPRNEVRVVWYVFFRMGSFYLSAWVLIAIYFALDLLGTLSSHSGVAYIAHVGGSLAGFLCGAALLMTGLVPAGADEAPLFRGK